MNPDILQKILGGAMMAGSALTGNGRLGRAGYDRLTAPGQQVPKSIPGYQTPASVYGIPTSPLPPPGTPPIVPPPDGSQLPYSTGGGSPRPAFRLPSAGTELGLE